MSTLIQTLISQPLYLLGGILASIILAHVLPYFLDPYQLRRFPSAHPLAGFSDVWLAYHAKHGNRYRVIHEAHLKYGKFVRIAPNHLSIADPEALPSIYGHGTGTLKSNFYDAFVSIHRGLFNTRDRSEHTRKRKIVSHTFSQQSIKEFEPYIHEVVENFIRAWDERCDQAKKAGNGWWAFDCLPWFNFLAFDVIGSLAFGAPFGMIDRGADIAIVEDEQGNVAHLSAVQILNDRGEFSATQGVLPPWIRPYTKYIDPFFNRGQTAVSNLAGIARNRVNKRLNEGAANERKDLLARLQAGRDEHGNPMGKAELTAEALTQLIAGSDTTSNSSCAITFFIVRHPEVHKKLVAELDAKFKSEQFEGVMDFDQVKDLPYLEACINEALRRHSTSSMGLPRIITSDTTFKDVSLPAGVICSVPSYTIHHLESVWKDPMVYRPERWIGLKDVEKIFIPFSVGPRSCVGRNVAFMELLIFIATLFYRYDIKLQDPTLDELPSREGFLRKPLESFIEIRRRQD